MKLIDIAGECSRTSMEAMNQRNFKSIHGVRISWIGCKYLEKGKTGGGIGYTGS
jgi:hypothetical protein